jgi:hypothetical protein
MGNNLDKINKYISSLNFKKGFFALGEKYNNISDRDIKVLWRMQPIDVIMEHRLITSFEYALIVSEFCKENDIDHYVIGLCCESKYERKPSVYPVIYNKYGYRVLNALPFESPFIDDVVEHMTLRILSSPNTSKALGGIVPNLNNFVNLSYSMFAAKLESNLRNCISFPYKEDVKDVLDIYRKIV